VIVGLNAGEIVPVSGFGTVGNNGTGCRFFTSQFEEDQPFNRELFYVVIETGKHPSPTTPQSARDLMSFFLLLFFIYLFIFLSCYETFVHK
jgi:hypothetical protein